MMPMSARTFVHPGIDMNKADLEYMRNQVIAGKQPWKGEFEKLKEYVPADFKPTPYAHVIRGPYGKPDIGASDLSKSAECAYSCAILWYISREDHYAETVRDIIAKWSDKLRGFDENDSKLIVGLTGSQFCNAAEILRYNYPGWTEEDTQNTTKLLMSSFYPTIRFYYSIANGNWDGAILHTLLAIAVFTDNEELFDNATYHFLHGSSNGSLIKYIYPSGQCQETRRDQGHVQLGLFEFSSAARIAYTQGVDLFSAADNRLALGLEYSAAFICGDSVFVYGNPSQRERYKYRPGFDYFVDHYTGKGIDMPHLRELCDRVTTSNQTSALLKLTAYRDEFKVKPSKLRKVQESKIAYHAGAPIEASSPAGKSIVEVTASDDLQKVIDENAGSGKTIFLHGGEYTMQKSLRIPSDVHICGEGRNTVILCTKEVHTAAILLGDLDARNITIENIVIEGASQHKEARDPNSGRFRRTGIYDNALAGIAFWGEPGHSLGNIVFRNISILNFSRSGIYISDADGVTVVHCDITQNGSQAIPGPRLTHNLMLQHCKNVKIMDSRLDTSIKGCGLCLDNCESVQVSDCEIARNGWCGVAFAETHDCKINGCLIEGNDDRGVLGEYLYDGSSDISVTNNAIQYNNGYGIQTYSVKRITSKGNTYRWNGRNDTQEDISQEKKLQLEQL
jgi:hypothetical protein